MLMENLLDCECEFYEGGMKLSYSVSTNSWNTEDSNINHDMSEQIEHAHQCMKRCLDLEQLVSSSELGSYEDSFPLVISRKSNKEQMALKYLEQLTIHSSPTDSLETGNSSFVDYGSQIHVNNSFSRKSRSPQPSFTSQEHDYTSGLSKNSFTNKSYRPGFGWAFMTSNSTVQMNFTDGVTALLDVNQGVITFTDPKGGTTNFPVSDILPKITDFEQSISLIIHFKQKLTF